MVKYKNYQWRKSSISNRYELVQYYDETHCITLAFFEIGSDDCDMITVSTRYHDIDVEDMTAVNKITKAFMHFLIALHEATGSEE